MHTHEPRTRSVVRRCAGVTLPLGELVDPGGTLIVKSEDGVTFQWATQ